MKKNISLIYICDESLTLARHWGWSPLGPRHHRGLLPLEPSECPLWPVTGWMLIAHPNLVPQNSMFLWHRHKTGRGYGPDRKAFLLQFVPCEFMRGRCLYLKKVQSEERRRPWLLSAAGTWVGLVAAVRHSTAHLECATSASPWDGALLCHPRSSCWLVGFDPVTHRSPIVNSCVNFVGDLTHLCGPRAQVSEKQQIIKCVWWLNSA